MNTGIDFTDYVMSRYSRKATAKGAMIARIKEVVLHGENPANWMNSKLKDSRTATEDRHTLNEILKDWSKELKKIEAGTSKVEKFAGGQPLGTSSELDRASSTIAEGDTAAGDPYEGLTLDLGAFYEECFG